MNIHQLFRYLAVDPVKVSNKSKFLAVASSFMAILMVAWITQKSGVSSNYPIVVASMGASAVILFIMPNSPVAQPWPLVGGHLISAIIGITCAQWLADTSVASACAAGGSVLAMLLLRCLHPPGAATALTPIIASDPVNIMNYSFVLMPVGVNVGIMLVMAIVMNRWLSHYEYPVNVFKGEAEKQQLSPLIQPSQRTGISELDVKQAIENMDMFVDVSTGDLSKLLTDAQRQSFIRHRRNITCADIMMKNVLSIEYGTEVEEAWQIMQSKKVKALPVVDRARRVIGIVTWNDFFKYINAGTTAPLRQKFLAFIRRSPDVTTDKPEYAGHIMTRSVSVLAEHAHIADLIPLMSNQGYRQIPIVNSENRLVGMVYQANLIAALYNESHEIINNQPLLI